MLQQLLRWLWQGLAIIDLVLLSLVLFLASWLPKNVTAVFYRPVFRYWCRVFIHALDIDLRMHQHYKTPLPETFILVANHPSIFEDIGIPASFNVYPVAKHEVKHWFIGGRIAQAAETLFVNRDCAESRQAVSIEISEALKSGRSVALFPEGGCKGKRIHDFRWGIFDISLQTGTPIVPVFLHYEAQDEFEWKDHETAPRKIWQLLNLSNNRANYHVFDAVYPEDFNDKTSYCDAVHHQYLEWQTRYLD